MKSLLWELAVEKPIYTERLSHLGLAMLISRIMSILISVDIFLFWQS